LMTAFENLRRIDTVFIPELIKLAKKHKGKLIIDSSDNPKYGLKHVCRKMKNLKTSGYNFGFKIVLFLWQVEDYRIPIGFGLWRKGSGSVCDLALAGISRLRNEFKLKPEIVLADGEYCADKKENILKLGNKWADSGYLLTQENGLPMPPDSLTDYCLKFRKKYNEKILVKNKKLPKKEQLKEIPHINPHAFRHSQASILFFEGVEAITISKRLGHANVSTTTDIYSHIMKQADETASTKLDELLNLNC